MTDDSRRTAAEQHAARLARREHDRDLSTHRTRGNTRPLDVAPSVHGHTITPAPLDVDPRLLYARGGVLREPQPEPTTTNGAPDA